MLPADSPSQIQSAQAGTLTSLQENGIVTKKDMARAIAETTGLTLLETQAVIQKTLDAVVATLLFERRVELRGFGVFEVRQRAARNGRNPRTGEKVFVPAKLVVAFKPSNEVNDRLDSKPETPAGTSDAA